MLLGSVCGWVAFSLFSSSLAIAAETVAPLEVDPQVEYNGEIKALLNDFCINCHGDKRPKGGVNLAKFTDIASIQRDPKTWQSVITQLQERNMPPDGKTQPTDAQRTRLSDWFTHTLNNADESYIPKDPGRIVIHRLNRNEYNNTVRDLFGVDIRPGDKFPADGAGGAGFDNTADTLFIPPILLEKYMVAAKEVMSAVPDERIFFVHPDRFTAPAKAARQIITHFAWRAFRRPPEASETELYLKLFNTAEKQGATFEEAVRVTLRAMLVSPNFLFRIEREQDAKAAYALNEFELASRLSYFLWSSMPDEELFRLAAQGRLQEQAVLLAQTRRMLQDPKARAFADSFSSQWLGTRNLNSTAQPDLGRFPMFTPALRDAMYAEAVDFFQSVMRDNASLLNFIDADYTFVNEELAKHYGFDGVKGTEMRRVALKDRTRGGVMGMAGVLTLTSYPLRTSPVLRGKWVLEEILGTPPPPPPPLVPGLTPDDRPTKEGLTFRQRLEQHREKPECASCHKRMDPIGFGLENFDPIGRYREKIADVVVDSSGVMASGEQFSGPAELKVLLLQRKEEFVRNLTEKMLSYSLGRGLEYYDMPAVRKITAKLAENDYQSFILIAEVVQSFPFQYRRNDPIEVTQK